MIDTGVLRSKILDLAIRGKLTEQLPEDGSAEDLYAKIQEEKAQLVKEGKIKKEKDLPEITEAEIPFEIPKNWKWVHLGELFAHNTGKALNSSDREGVLLEYITTSNMYWDHFELDGLKKMYFKNDEIEKCTIRKGDLLICEGGDIGRSAIWNFDYDMRIQNHIHRLRSFVLNLSPKFYYYVMRIYKDNKMISGQGIGLQGFSSSKVHLLLVPLPPFEEQKRIIDKVNDILEKIDEIENLQSQYTANAEVLKSKLIDAAICGKLTEQLPEDGFVKEQVNSICPEINTIIEKDEQAFKIPDNWYWIKLGWVIDIERGGSPRPIKSYLTNDADGINWIKIGDVEKDGKYITSTKEKIKPEGEKKSRRVYPGDFLLTNSMSFGRPYISKITGCVHDGWLILRNSKDLFDLDFLYLVLSSAYVYNQFCKKASGATVDNLNIDKVSDAVIPLPPLSEQKRIVGKIDVLLNVFD